MRDRGVQARLAQKRVALIAGYRESWGRMVREWQAPRSGDAVWLMYSGNYLLHTGGVRWAVDPVLLDNKLPEAPALDARHDLGPLRFVLLTHAHSDHVDVRLWNQLAALDCRWVVPEPMVPLFVEATSVPRSRFSVAVENEGLEIDGVRVHPFAAPHHERTASGERTGVPSTGYLIEVGSRRYLLPGDVRTYEPGALEAFGPVAAVFAHVFLGRSAALSASPPLLDAFVRFYCEARPKKVLLTHLYEVSREAADCWREEHAQEVRAAFLRRDAGLDVSVPQWYTEIDLQVQQAELAGSALDSPTGLRYTLVE